MCKFRFGKFTSGKYEVNLRKFERMVYIYLPMAESGEWQSELGREQRHEARIHAIVSIEKSASDKL
jgi:hypothetical protein